MGSETLSIENFVFIMYDTIASSTIMSLLPSFSSPCLPGEHADNTYLFYSFLLLPPKPLGLSSYKR